jgi:nucleoid-associated protein EbfC
MEVNAIQQMLSRLRQVQEDLQRQVNSVTVEATSGGGMVAVKMNGSPARIKRCCKIWCAPR